MVKTVINDDLGVVTTPGSSGIVLKGKVSFAKAPTPLSQTPTTDKTLTADDAGVVILNATASPRTLTLPAASTCAGLMFVFRATSAALHALTGSASDPGVSVIKNDGGELNVTGSVGSKLTFAAATDDSCVLLCDGAQFLVIANHGAKNLTGV